jgi:NAD(P)-dependent dehydrogenase (short-subunit alcohol dehydrogenase family)
MTPSSKPVALVTGANKGIGFEVARAIAKSGYVVWCENSAEDGSPKNRCVDAFGQACTSGTSARICEPTIPQARPQDEFLIP